MSNFKRVSKPLIWWMTLVLVTLVAGCGGGGKDPILGAGGAVAVVPPVVVVVPPAAILPGAVCSVGSGPTIPTVTSTIPTAGNQFVTTSTTGVAGSGKQIQATFSLAMNPATIDAASFYIGPTGGTVLTPASVGYDAASKVATLTTSAALLADTAYTVVITTATSVGPPATPIACPYAWTFKTAALPVASLPAVNMGLASTFGISATAGLATAISSSTVNGDVLLDPLAQCNTTVVDGAGGIGSCAAIGFAPTVNGTVISSLYNPGLNLAAIKADLNTAFLSVTPPAGPPAAGSMGGGTTLPAPTTLGGLPPPAALVQGVNYFVPGVYTDTGSSIMITGDLTLDALGDPDANFVFQSFSTIGTAAGAAGIPGTHTRILLVNGAKASNVWWVAASSATIGTFTEFNGNVLAAVSITLNNGATSCGRMMAGAWVGGGGAITLGGANVVSVPGSPSAPVGCI